MADGRAEREKAKRPQPAGGEHVAPLAAELWGGNGLRAGPAGVEGVRVLLTPPCGAGPCGERGRPGPEGLRWRRGRVAPAVLSFTALS